MKPQSLSSRGVKREFQLANHQLHHVGSRWRRHAEPCGRAHSLFTPHLMATYLVYVRHFIVPTPVRNAFLPQSKRLVSRPHTFCVNRIRDPAFGFAPLLCSRSTQRGYCCNWRPKRSPGIHHPGCRRSGLSYHVSGWCK